MSVSKDGAVMKIIDYNTMVVENLPNESSFSGEVPQEQRFSYRGAGTFFS